MLHRLRIVCLMAAVVVCGQVFGQDGQAGEGAAPQDTPKSQSPADAAFEPLGRDFQNLQQSLRNKNGIAPEDHNVIRALRNRAAVFSREFPDDTRGPALELVLSKWLKDDELLDVLYARIIKLEPQNWQVRLSWAQSLIMQNRFPEVLEVMDPLPPEMLKETAPAQLYADALFAEHRFQDVVDALEHLPEASLPSTPEGPTTRIGTVLQGAKQCLALWPEELSMRQQEEAADDLPRVLMVTSKGQITLELFENQSPNTVANFISLIDRGFYNTTKFHRVISNFMAQGGDPNSKPGGTGVPGEGNPGYYIPDEHEREDHRNHFTGVLSMAKTAAPNSGGCQFFITVTPTPHLNGKHTVFGRVIEGLDVVRALQEQDEIELVTVTRRRPHDYVPTTLPLIATTPPPAPSTESPDEQPQAEPSIPPSDEEPQTEPSMPPSDEEPPVSPPPGDEKN